MLTTNQKKIAALVALGLLWVVIIVWEWGTMKEPVRVPLTNVSGRVSAARETSGTADGLHVQLDLLAAVRTQREMTFTPSRNIFALLRPDDSRAPYADQPKLDAESEQALRQQVALEGLALFHYLGFVRMEERSRKKGEMAVLTKKDDLHVVRAGEMVDAHVMVKAITQESVTLQDRQSRVEHTVLLSKEDTLDP
ncbi:MAG: hypothetical protein ABI604_02060 [Nitrospirota bacterium]